MWCWQDLFPPLFALVAASAEVNAARGLGSQMGSMLPRLRRSMVGLASMDSVGSQAYYALMWAAGAFKIASKMPFSMLQLQWLAHFDAQCCCPWSKMGCIYHACMYACMHDHLIHPSVVQTATISGGV